MQNVKDRILRRRRRKCKQCKLKHIGYLLLLFCILVVFLFILKMFLPQSPKRQLRKQKLFHAATDVDVVLAAWILGAPDAQAVEPTHVKPSNTFRYIQNFYMSAMYLGLHVVILHDHLSENFIQQYQTQRIQFYRVPSPPAGRSPQDHRFFEFQLFLKDYRFRQIVFADISDVFFFHDPFQYMKRSSSTLFVQTDVGNLQNNLWAVVKYKFCFNMTKLPKVDLYNDGIIAGKAPHIYTFLDCMVNALNEKRHGENCNMMACNVCLYQPRFKILLEKNTALINPFLHECGNDGFSIIHNKCIKSDPDGGWNDKIVDLVHGKIILKDT